MFTLTSDQRRGLLFFTAFPWFLLGLCMGVNWQYTSILWRVPEARERRYYLFAEYLVALLMALLGCIGLNRSYPPDGGAVRARGILNFTIFVFLTVAMLPVAFGILGLPAYIQLKKNLGMSG